MVAEAAALRLGTTVAGAAGSWWLGRRRREQERHLPLQELIRVKVPGLRLQREVSQQFEQITNAVFDRLEPFLQHAFDQLEEGGRAAVLDAVCDTFAKADLSDEALFAADAQPASLTRQITRSVPPPPGLGDTESRLFELLFAECVEYYVRIVRSLPAFEERAAAELLSRTSTLGNEVARLLRRLPDRSLFAPEGTDQDTAFRRQYLELVSRDLDEVELYRSTSGQSAAPRVRASVAYVSLRTTGEGAQHRRAGRARMAPQLRADMRDWSGAAGETSGMAVETALGGVRRALLRGEAGCGKSTLLRWLAITAARGGFTGALEQWNGLTPVLVKLREYSGRSLPAPEGMLDGVAGHITGIMPRGWVERLLASGGVLLMLDGVDELVERERRAAREWLRRLLRQYPDIRTVVTSRPAAAGADWLRGEEFTPLHLDRMTPAELAAFVRNWHQAVRELGEDELPCAAEEIPGYELSLLTSLQERPHLQSLAGTPLLAAMLCAMHLQRRRQLPRDRMELYRNALDTLVHNRDADRNVPSALESELSLSDKTVILRDLAWRLSDNNRTEIDEGRAVDHVAAKLRGMRHLKVTDGAEVLSQLRHRSGLLRSPAERRIDFVHRTFQEYLAAKEAAEEDRIGNLIGRAHLDQWRETIVMTAGHANSRQREELLTGILERADADPRHARALRLVAAACQETLPSASPELADRLDAAVRGLLPARRSTDPPALAALGPPLLRWMPRSLDGLTDNAAAQTIRTVALVGGRQALRLLAGYAEETRPAAVGQLMAGWDYFDAETYAEEVLSRVRLGDTVVPISHPGQQRAARRLPAMRYAQLRFPVQDLRCLADFPQLRGLRTENPAGGIDVSDIADLQPGLRTLRIYGVGSPRGLSELRRLSELRHLALTVFSGAALHDLSGLRLSALELDLPLPGPDLRPLGECPDLTRLSLATINAGRQRLSPRGLAAMPALAELRIAGYDTEEWLADPGSVPGTVTELGLVSCRAPLDRAAYARFGQLRSVELVRCKSHDHPERVTRAYHLRHPQPEPQPEPQAEPQPHPQPEPEPEAGPSPRTE